MKTRREEKGRRKEEEGRRKEEGGRRKEGRSGIFASNVELLLACFQPYFFTFFPIITGACQIAVNCSKYAGKLSRSRKKSKSNYFLQPLKKTTQIGGEKKEVHEG